MKRFFSGLLTVVLLFSLIGCQKTEPSIPVPEVPAEEQPAEPSSKLPDGPLYLLTAEYGRLYAVNAEGESALLRDAYCTSFTRNGQKILAAFSDGSIYLYDLAAETEEYITSTHLPAHQLLLGDSGFFYACASMMGGHQAIYRFADQTESEITEYSWDNILLGNSIAFSTWKNDQTTLILIDLSTGQIVSEIPLEGIFQSTKVDGTLYVQEDHWAPNNVWKRVDWEQQVLVPADISLPTDHGQILTHGAAGFLLDDHYYGSETPGIWIWNDGNAVLTDIPSLDDCWTNLVDEINGKALLQTSVYHTVNENHPDDSLYYSTNQYWLYDVTSGTVTEIPFTSDTAKFFADGDFPVLDSSTARKRVTQSLYSLFCLQSQAGGQPPLCSTTHGAWTNMADRTIDLALLAEPTSEEQAYLKEQNVEIEMKLYGGDGLVFIGNDACGVTDLTLEQIRGIYRGEITNWSELGGVDAEIHVLYRDDQSGSQRLFEKLVWKNEEVPDFESLGFVVLDEMSGIVSSCLYDPYAIGYSIMTYLNDVYRNEDLLAFSLNGVEATPEQVAAQKYPLGTQGYVVIRADEPESSPARRLYNWFGSPICDELLEGSGVTPLHD